VTSLWQPAPSPHYLRLPGGTCADGWQPITTDLACQAAAQSLGLPAPTLPLRRFTKRPTGCYFVPNSDPNSGTLWMNTFSNDVGEVFDNVAGWVPETICARRGASDTAPVPPPVTPAPAPAPVVCQYVVGLDGQAACPGSAVALNETECREMPYHFGGMLHSPFAVSNPVDPHGCFFFGAHYYYNVNPGGMGRPARKVYCKHCQAVPALSQHVGGDWTEWTSDSAQTLALARSTSSRFRKLSVGKCTDIHWYPIHAKGTCEEAARYLQLQDVEASITQYAERPEGCYYFRNYADGTQTLWVDLNPWSRGKGAETSDLASGGLRQPICSRQPTSGTAASGAAPGGGAYAADRSMIATSVDNTQPVCKISAGRCMDIHWRPILDADVCASAANILGLVDIVPTMMSHAEHPEGCYYFFNSEDLTATLWLNTSPLSRGNGAQVAQASPRGMRQPLCSNPAVAQK